MVYVDVSGRLLLNSREGRVETRSSTKKRLQKYTREDEIDIRAKCYVSVFTIEYGHQ